MPPTMQEAPYWWRVILSLAESLLTVEVVIQQGLTTAFRGVKSIVGGAHNLTTSTYQHFARTIRAPPHVDDSSGFYTVLLAPGCEDIAPNCVLRTFDITEDLKGVTAIAAGPRPFAITSPKINIDSWRLPTFYAYNPWNYTSHFDRLDDRILPGSANIPTLGTDPLIQILHLPSSDKALALVKQPLAANPPSGDWVPVPVAATFLCIAVSLSLSYLLFWCVGWIPSSKKQWKKVNLDAYVAEVRSEESNKALVRINDVEQQKLQLEKGYKANVHSLRHELEQSRTDRESVQSELDAWRSDKATAESKLRKCTTEKEAAESNLLLCTSDKDKVEAELRKTAAACSEANEQFNILKGKVTEAKSAQEEARRDVICAREEAKANIERAQEEAADQVQAAEQNAEERAELARANAEKQIEAARAEADTKVKQAEDEPDKAKSAQKEAEDKVELNRQESEKNLASAQQEAEQKFDSAEREAEERIESAHQQAEEKFESAQQKANEAAKLGKEDAEKNIKSIEKAAETKLNDTIAKYNQHEKQLQDELSTAKTTINQLQPYKDKASTLSEEVDSLENDLSLKQEEYRGEMNDLSDQHDDTVNSLRREHDNAIEGLHQERRGELHSLREQQGVAMKELEEKHGNEVQELKGKLEEYGEMRSELAGAKQALKDAKEEAISVRQQLVQAQGAIRDNGILKADNEKLCNEEKTLQTQLQAAGEGNEKTKAEKVKLSDEKDTLLAQLQKITNEKQAGSEEFDLEKDSLREQLQITQTQLKTATTQFEADKGSLQENLQAVQVQLKTATAQHKSTEESLQAKVEQATESVSRTEAANKDLSQEVARLQEQRRPLAESIVSKDDRIQHLENGKEGLVMLKDAVTTELPVMKNALEKAERSDEEIKQDLATAADHKKKRRNRRKHRNGRYSTDRPHDANHSESDSMSEDSPAAQTVQQPIQQPLGSPIEEEVEEVTEKVSNLAFYDDAANSDGGNAREAAETDASDSGSSSIPSTFRFLPDAASFVPAVEAQPAITGFSKQPEASTTPMESEFTRAETTRAEGSTHTPTVVEEGITELKKRSSPVSPPKSGTNVSDTPTLAREVHKREEAHAAPPVSTPSESLSEKDRSAAATQDRPLVVSTGNVSPIEAGKIDVNGDTAILHVSASSSRDESEPPSVSRAPIATGSPTAAQSSTAKALQRVNAEPSTPTADIKFHEPKYGRPDFVTEEVAAQRAEDLKKSMWAAQTSGFTSNASGQTPAPCKAAQIFKSCIDDAKGDKDGKNLQNSRWADVAPEVKTPAGPAARLPQQTVPSTRQSGKSTTSAVSASKAMLSATPQIAVKPPSPANLAPVAPASATLSSAAANPVSASSTEAPAATAPTVTAPITVASVQVAAPVRASQYSSSAHAAAARSSDIPKRGRGTGLGSGRGIDRGGRGRGGAGRGKGTGRGIMQNHELPDWLAEDLAGQAAEAQSSVTTLSHAPSAANDPPTAVTTAISAPGGPSKTVDQRTVSATSSVQGVKAETKDQLSKSQSATNNDTATSSRPVPNSQIGSSTLQSKHAAKPRIQHQLFESKYATNSSSSNDITTTSRPKVKNDLLQSKYATND